MAAESYDALDGGQAAVVFGFPELRKQLLQKAKGRVLEIAIGTGLNLQYYDYGQIDVVTGLDISPGMLEQVCPN